MASPLYKLTEGSPKPGSKIEWSKDEQKSFEELKAALSQTVPLQHPVPFRPFVLDTDASGTNVGAVLQQDQVTELSKEGPFNYESYLKKLKNQNLRPVAFESRKLSRTEQNCSAQERELLAIIHGLKHFRGFIEGSPGLVRTDHESLKHFKTQRHVNRRLARFVDEIKFFNCHIIYRPGKEQLAADSLSRKPNTGLDEDPPETARPLFTITNDEDSFATLLRYKRQLQANIDPAMVGSGNF